MKVSELTDQEVLALVTMAKYMVHVDGVVSGDEMLDLMSLGEAIGMDRFSQALDACKDHYKNLDSVGNIASRVGNYQSRVLIFCLLEEVAKGDGSDELEEKFLQDLRNFWKI
jgi:hypothetical protein